MPTGQIHILGNISLKIVMLPTGTGGGDDPMAAGTAKDEESFASSEQASLGNVRSTGSQSSPSK